MEISVRLWVKTLFLICLGMELAIALGDFFLNYLEWVPWRPARRIFNITREDGLANWWSSLQTLLTGAILWMTWLARERKQWGWALMAGFFTLMAVDDATKAHERIGSSLKIFMESGSGRSFMNSFPSYSWQLFLGPFFVAMGFFILFFLWKNIRDRTGRLLFLGGLSLFSLAVILDFIEGMNIRGLTGYPARHNMKLVEEFMEMLGNTCFLTVFFRTFLESLKSEISIKIGV